MSYINSDTDINMLTGDKWCEAIHLCFESQLAGQKNKETGKATIPALIGPPGIGKTQKITNTYVDWLKRNGSRVLGIDNPTVHVHTIILSQGDNVDIGGAFAPDFDTGTLKHLIIKDILGKIEGVDADIIILLFDELGNANASMLAACQSLFEDGKIRGHLKAENCVYAVATNRPEDGTNSIKLPRSLVEGRLVSMPMGVDTDEWLAWADSEGIYPKLRHAVDWRRSLLYKYDPKAKGVNPTPRGYEKASSLIHQMIERSGEIDQDILDVLIPGCIGEGTYAEIRGFWRHSEHLPFCEDVINHPDTCSVPGGDGDHAGDGPSGQYAIATNLADHLRDIHKRGEVLPSSHAEAIIKYFRRMEQEIACIALRWCANANPDFIQCSEYGELQTELQGLHNTQV